MNHIATNVWSLGSSASVIISVGIDYFFRLYLKTDAESPLIPFTCWGENVLYGLHCAHALWTQIHFVYPEIVKMWFIQ